METNHTNAVPNNNTNTMINNNSSDIFSDTEQTTNVRTRRKRSNINTIEENNLNSTYDEQAKRKKIQNYKFSLMLQKQYTR